MAIENFIKYWRKKKGLKQKDISELAGVDRTFLSQVENGKKNPSAEYLKKISSVLNVTVTQILDGPAKDLTEYTNGERVPGLGTIRVYDPADTIPVLARMPAGCWKEWINDYPNGCAEEYIPRYDLRGKHIFAVCVDGDSMEPELHNGDLLVIDPDIAFHPSKGGRIGVVKFDDEYQVRRVHLTKDENSYLLEPLNKAYEPEVVPVTGTTIFKIVELRPRREGLF